MAEQTQVREGAIVRMGFGMVYHEVTEVTPPRPPYKRYRVMTRCGLTELVVEEVGLGAKLITDPVASVTCRRCLAFKSAQIAKRRSSTE